MVSPAEPVDPQVDLEQGTSCGTDTDRIAVEHFRAMLNALSLPVAEAQEEHSSWSGSGMVNDVLARFQADAAALPVQ